MDMAEDPGSVLVRRITIDEKFAEGMIRILIAPLAKGVTVFFNQKTDWDDEYEFRVYPETYVQELGIPTPTEWTWEKLVEGQVFVSGEFETVGDDPAAPEYLRVCPGRPWFLRIDELEGFKQSLKWLYSRALTGGV